MYNENRENNKKTEYFSFFLKKKKPNIYYDKDTLVLKDLNNIFKMMQKVPLIKIFLIWCIF